MFWLGMITGGTLVFAALGIYSILRESDLADMVVLVARKPQPAELIVMPLEHEPKANRAKA